MRRKDILSGLGPCEPDTILVIDDDAELCRYLEFLFKEAGYDVITAESGSAGEESAVRNQPALIILDINLPSVGGYDVLQQLKSQEETRDIPVVMLSAETSIASHKRCATAGAAGFLDKPLDVDELRAVVRRCLR